MKISKVKKITEELVNEQYAITAEITGEYDLLS